MLLMALTYTDKDPHPTHTHTTHTRAYGMVLSVRMVTAFVPQPAVSPLASAVSSRSKT